MDDSIPDLIRRIALSSRQRADVIVRELDISGSTGRLLGYIEAEEHRGVIQRDLADMSGVRPASITAALQVLEERGLVERRADPADDRRKTVHMTAAGTALVARFRDAIRDFDRESLAALTDQEQRTLHTLLAKLAASNGASR